jgi:hypothetical protein
MTPTDFLGITAGTLWRGPEDAVFAHPSRVSINPGSEWMVDMGAHKTQMG